MNFNKKDTRKFYKLLRHYPDEFTELRAFEPNVRKPPKERVWVQNADDFVEFCRKWNGKALVYVGLNPRKTRGGKAEHVSRIIGIPWDVDPDTPKDVSATDEEKQVAYETLGRLKEFLIKKGFKPPYIDDSGNGFHAIQWVDIPFDNKEEIAAKLKAYFDEVKAFFRDLDSIFDPPRVLKVPGTWALKGADTKERPHRQAKILEQGESGEDHKLTAYILSLEPEKIKTITPTKTALKTPSERIKEVLPILRAIQKNKNLNDLYEGKLSPGKIKEHYGSRSEAEYYLIYSMYRYGLKPSDIPRVMTGSKIGKWTEETRNYRDRTIKKTWAAFKENPNRFFNEKGKFIPAKLAEEILEDFRFAATDEKSKIWTYNSEKGIWENNGIEKIHTIATKLLKDTFRSIHVTETVKYIRYSNYIKPGLLGGHVDKIVTINGVLNLNTFELTPFDPELYEINQIPVTYNSDAKCPKITKFLNEVLKPGDFDAVTELIGYCLYKKYSIARIFMLVGEGRNGKSQLIIIIHNFLGKENTSDLVLQQIAENTFAPALLYGKLANLAADIPAKPIKHTGILKTLSGGDRITAHHKYYAFFDFENYAKLIFSANEVPPTNDDTPAWLRRPILITFPNIFPAGDPGTIMDIGNKISTDEELSGLLNLALKGLQRLLKQGKFTGEKGLQKRSEQFIKESDPAHYFITRFIEEDLEPFSRIEKGKLYKHYVKLCFVLKRRPKASNIFSQKIVQFLPFSTDDGEVSIKLPKKTEKGKAQTKKIRVWYGLKVKIKELTEEIAKLKHGTVDTVDTIACIPANTGKDIEEVKREGKEIIVSTVSTAPKDAILDVKLEEIRNWIMRNKDADGDVSRFKLEEKISEYGFNITEIVNKFKEEGLISGATDTIGAWRVTSQEKTLAEKLKITLQLITSIEKETGMTSREKLLGRLQAQYNILPGEADKLVYKLLREGALFSPREGYLKKT